MKKRKKKKKVVVKRHASLAGRILIGYICVGLIWPCDFAWRAWQKRDPDRDLSAGIIADGNFAGSETITLQVPETPKPTEPPVRAPEEPTPPRDTNIAAFPTEETVPAGYVAIPMGVRDVNNGRLLLLDSTAGFTGSAGELGTFENKNASYRLKNNELKIKPEVVDAMNRMAAAYETVTGRVDLMIYSTTEAYGVDGSLYPDVLPDRGTGYCVDICLLNEDGTIDRIREDSPWLTGNAYLYGFVRSYTKAESEATGIASAPYHFRYVGKVNAMIMHEQGLTLSAYLESVRSHTYEDPYRWSDGSTNWIVYYVPAKHGGTNVPVPLNANYDISGNNTDGFIVTAEGKAS